MIPANNSVERAQRPAVQWRKTSFGNRSAEGERAVSRLLTVAQTCRMQKRHVLDYLTQAIDCHRGKQPVPSLLPKQARGEVAASAQASGKNLTVSCDLRYNLHYLAPVSHHPEWSGAGVEEEAEHDSCP